MAGVQRVFSTAAGDRYCQHAARIEGKAGVRAKGEWRGANHEVHDVLVEGPYLYGDQFVVRFKMELTRKGGERITMDEVGLYTIKDGKIAEERFFYGG